MQPWSQDRGPQMEALHNQVNRLSSSQLHLPGATFEPTIEPENATHTCPTTDTATIPALSTRLLVLAREAAGACPRLIKLITGEQQAGLKQPW